MRDSADQRQPGDERHADDRGRRPGRRRGRADGGGTLERRPHRRQPVDREDERTATRIVAGSADRVRLRAASPEPVTVARQPDRGNTAVARSDAGTATAQGAGVYNNSLLDLRNDAVSHNAGKAVAPSGAAQGGGIWNGVLLTGPPVELTLDRLADHPQLAHRRARGSSAAAAVCSRPSRSRGTRTLIAGNVAGPVLRLRCRQTGRQRRPLAQYPTGSAGGLTAEFTGVSPHVSCRPCCEAMKVSARPV